MAAQTAVARRVSRLGPETASAHGSASKPANLAPPAAAPAGLRAVGAGRDRGEPGAFGRAAARCSSPAPRSTTPLSSTLFRPSPPSPSGGVYPRRRGADRDRQNLGPATGAARSRGRSEPAAVGLPRCVRPPPLHPEAHPASRYRRAVGARHARITLVMCQQSAARHTPPTHQGRPHHQRPVDAAHPDTIRRSPMSSRSNRSFSKDRVRRRWRPWPSRLARAFVLAEAAFDGISLFVDEDVAEVAGPRPRASPLGDSDRGGRPGRRALVRGVRGLRRQQVRQPAGEELVDRDRMAALLKNPNASHFIAPKWTPPSSVRFKYVRHDLVVVDWDGALVFDPESDGDLGDGDPGDSATSIGCATGCSTGELDGRAPPRSPAGRGGRRGGGGLLQGLGNPTAAHGERVRLRSQWIADFQEVERETELIGDWYAARLSGQVTRRFHLDDCAGRRGEGEAGRPGQTSTPPRPTASAILPGSGAPAGSRARNMIRAPRSAGASSSCSRLLRARPLTTGARPRGLRWTHPSHASARASHRDPRRGAPCRGGRRPHRPGRASEAIAFHLLHDRCGGRSPSQSLSPSIHVAVSRKGRLVRGFEYAKDEYVRFTEERDEETDRGAPQQSDRRPGVRGTSIRGPGVLRPHLLPRTRARAGMRRTRCSGGQ